MGPRSALMRFADVDSKPEAYSNSHSAIVQYQTTGGTAWTKQEPIARVCFCNSLKPCLTVFVSGWGAKAIVWIRNCMISALAVLICRPKSSGTCSLLSMRGGLETSITYSQPRARCWRILTLVCASNILLQSGAYRQFLRNIFYVIRRKVCHQKNATRSHC